ncbi:hypothetical protein Tco_1366759, partial [Tanacetum coccineum]
EILYNFPRFFGVLITKFTTGGAVNALKMEGDMIIENLDLEPKINAMMRDFLKWEELIKETSSEILPSRDGSHG